LVSDVLFSLLRTAHVLEESFAGALGEAGLSPVEFDILSELVSAGGPLPEGELASGAVLDRLEAGGLVRRDAGIAITPLGRERHDAGAARLAAARRHVFELMSGADREGLERALSVLRGERRSERSPTVRALEQAQT
jgi:hypothetical protein